MSSVSNASPEARRQGGASDRAARPRRLLDRLLIALFLPLLGSGALAVMADDPEREPPA